MTKKLLRLYVIVSGFVINVASETLRNLEDERLTTLLATKTIILKRVQKYSTTANFIIALIGSGGACKLSLTNCSLMESLKKPLSCRSPHVSCIITKYLNRT
ncbi:hypothetical protein EYB33_06515 [Lysinibacillus sphaericus]|uniref:hypothetical protein n=1 Tax=Lysinibacillus sphaericus TaxID=1421 RepID=UPI001E2F8D9A|nr:hypothetical protein [Lysinibacillus sphaericus]MCS1380989.1 hypothetical protein [Lysinibacillus sphaericus]UDK95960.1 hypothetical protein EYB33_06515 [Lysinibacillus sphaericus]